MRVVLFKVWDKVDKVWIPVDEVYIYGNGKVSYKGLFVTRDVQVCFYTGVSDKDGNKIYEGDIINVLEVSNTKTEQYVTDIKWEDSCFLFMQGDEPDLDYYNSSFGTHIMSRNIYPIFEITLIGNIYENAKMLETFRWKTA